MATTSFQKKARVKIGQLHGTKPSLYNNQLLISTGIPSLDNVVGGGLGVGTVLMVEEDTYGNYARLMVKYFASEAIMTRQSLHLASIDTDCRQLVKELPAPVEQTNRISARKTGPSQHVNQSGDGEDKLKIAWRYENKPTFQNSPPPVTSFGHYYDLTQTMEADRVSQADISFSDPLDMMENGCQSGVSGMNPHYCRLLQDIQERIKSGQFGTDSGVKDRKILRIGIHSIGSPLWREDDCRRENQYDPSLALFLLSLKSMLRSSLAVALVTIPTHLFQEGDHIRRLYKVCDSVIRLESFAGSDKEKNPAFKEYHGLLHLMQLPRVNSLVPAHPETHDLAFKLRRKKFTIEKLHLPPDLSETASRSQESVTLFSKKSTGGCGSGNNSKLDF